MTTSRAQQQQAVMRMKRVIHAPRERVFRAWTDADEIKQWWGRPDGVDVPQAEVDLRIGGSYRIVMQRAGGGPQYPVSGTYLEVVPFERLVYSFRWERDLPFPGGDYTGDTRVTIEFRDLGDDTEIVVTHEGFPNDEVAGFHNIGWGWSFDRLAILIEKGSVD